MQDQQTEPTELGEAWLRLPLALSPQAERLTGANHEPMLYLEADRRYIRLSQGAARLLDALDGQTTAAEILARVGGDPDPIRAERRRQAVLATIDSLRMAGARHCRGRRPPRCRPRRLAAAAGAGPKADGHPTDRWRGEEARRGGRSPSTELSLHAGDPGSGQHRHDCRRRIAGLPRNRGPVARRTPVVLLAVAAHELGHAVVCRALGVPVREAGVMLWGWFLPLVYVDCTDMYRLPARRLRVMVALAGPYVDLATAGVCAAVGLSTRVSCPAPHSWSW